MTADRTKMPPDELMCKAVAKWKGVDVPFMVTTSTVGKGIVGLRLIGGGDIEVADPRSDTDAALELLHYIGVPLDPNMAKRHWWTPVNLTTTEVDESEYRSREYIPISGEPFRRAVCWLAVDVLGVR